LEEEDELQPPNLTYEEAMEMAIAELAQWDGLVV
jgi:hypothetical protein